MRSEKFFLEGPKNRDGETRKASPLPAN